MRITRDVQMALYAWSAAIANSRDDYRAHPTEFNKAKYCLDCSKLTRSKYSRRCAKCENARQEAKRAS